MWGFVGIEVKNHEFSYFYFFNLDKKTPTFLILILILIESNPHSHSLTLVTHQSLSLYLSDIPFPQVHNPPFALDLSILETPMVEIT